MHRDDDDFEDAPAKPKKKGMPVWGWLLGAGGAMLLVCTGLAVGGVLMIRSAAKSAASEVERSKQSDPKTKVWKEEELSTAVKGKTPEEVKALLGVPDGTGMVRDGVVPGYHYFGRLYDPNTEKPIGAYVKFEDGRATGSVR